MYGAIKWGFITVCVAMVMFALWQRGWLDRAPAPPLPAVQLSQAERQCVYVAAFHDGKKRIERVGAAMAHINRAKALGKTTCEIFTNFLTLVAPGNSVKSRRSPTFDYHVYTVTEAQKATFNLGVVALEECLANQEACFKEHPWLACVQFEIRNTWRKATPSPDYTLRTDPRVKRVYPPGELGKEDAEFFCPAS